MLITTIRNRHLFQRGDTIVEVLIAIAVVSLILGGAYVTTNRSLQATRSAQERGNALKNAEAQIERIKSLAATSPGTLFVAATQTPNKFCISNAGAIVTFPNALCTVGTDGAPTAAEPKYDLEITRNGYLFTITESWTDVSGAGGNKADKLQLKYRVYD